MAFASSPLICDAAALAEAADAEAEAALDAAALVDAAELAALDAAEAEAAEADADEALAALEDACPPQPAKLTSASAATTASVMMMPLPFMNIPP